MVLNSVGEIVKNVWQSLPDHYLVKLDKFQIMPNHIHFIIHLTGAGLSRPTGSCPTGLCPTGLCRPTVGQITAYFKYQSTKQINNFVNERNVGAGLSRPTGLYPMRSYPTRSSRPVIKKIFQRNFYEHIIRSQNELDKIREYVESNPFNWDL